MSQPTVPGQASNGSAHPAPRIERVAFYSRSGTHALSYLRLLGPAQQLGWTVIPGVEDGRVYPARAAEGEVVVVQREFPADLAAYEEVLRVARAAGKPVVLDLDDLLLELPEQHPDRRSHYYARALLPMLQALLEVDAVTVSTPRLREYVLQYNPNALVLPNYLNDHLWQLRAPSSAAAPEGPTVIGYMGGASHEPDLELIAPALHEIDRRYPGRLQFRFWGGKPPASLASLASQQWLPVEIYDYPAFADYFQQQHADIWIAPLRDGLFNACKSSIKYLEYSALGAPGVFSQIDPYSSVVTDGRNGLLASSTDEWTAALARLIEDPALRAQLASAAQDEIKADWLLSRNAARWEEAYQAARALTSGNKPAPSPFYTVLRSVTQQTVAEGDALRGEVRSLTEHLHETQSAKAQAEQSLAVIVQSRAWRVAQALQQARTTVLPREGALDRLVQKALGNPRRRRQLQALRQSIAAAFPQPAPAGPAVSIVIPAYDHAEHTVNCLLSVAAARPRASHEIILADDASSDETRYLFENIPGLRYVPSQQNLGFLKTCNRAAQAAIGSYLLFLNNDTLIHPGWLDQLLETFSLMPGTGLAGSKLILPDGTLQEAGSLIWADGSASNYGRGGDPRDYRYNFVREADYVSGASMMIPRQLWEELGGFDETYAPAYYEDVDLAFRVRQAGFKVVYQPFSVVTHVEGGTNGTDLESGIKRYQVLNQQKFREAWQVAIAWRGLPQPGVDPVQARRSPKGRVLFVDDSTPKPDRYAGGLLSEFYISTLVDAGYSVTFLPHLDTRYAEGYTRALEKKGVECLYAPHAPSSQAYLEQYGRLFDHVILSRATVAADLIDTVKKCAPQARVLFSTIDLHFLRLERAARQAREDELRVVQAADDTLVVTDAEAALLSNLLPQARLHVVPFPADVHPSPGGLGGRTDIVFLGGFGHAPNVDAVLFFAREVWPLLAAALPDARFVIAGADPVPQVQRLHGGQLVVRGYVEDLDDLFATARCSVAPLRYGAGLKGKILTSLGYGVPCVASSTAAEGTGLIDKENVLVANTPDEYVDRILSLYRSEDLWSALSQRGQEWVSGNYSRPAVASRLLDALNRLK